MAQHQYNFSVVLPVGRFDQKDGLHLYKMTRILQLYNPALPMHIIREDILFNHELIISIFADPLNAIMSLHNTTSGSFRSRLFVP